MKNGQRQRIRIERFICPAVFLAVSSMAAVYGVRAEPIKSGGEREVVSYALVDGLLASDSGRAALAEQSRVILGEPMFLAVGEEMTSAVELDYYHNTGQSTSWVDGLPAVSPIVRRTDLLPVVVIPKERAGALYRDLQRGRMRRRVYRKLIQLAAVGETMKVIRDDLSLITLSLTALEQKYGLRAASHLDLMALQNTRTLQESQLLIHSNRVEMFKNQLNQTFASTTAVMSMELILPRHIVLSSKRLEDISEFLDSSPLVQLLSHANPPTGANLGLRGNRSDSSAKGLLRQDGRLTKDSGIKRKPSLQRSSSPVEELGRRALESVFQEVLFRVNSTAIRYSAFADEIQLRDQEAVATAAAGLELGREEFVTVINYRRRLLADQMEMIRLRTFQHELLADLVYWSGTDSLSQLVGWLGTGNRQKDRMQ